MFYVCLYECLKSHLLVLFHVFCFVISLYLNFTYQEVKGVKEVKKLRRMFCCLKTTPKRLLS